MRFLIRLLGALWLATLLVSAGFAWYEVHRGAHAPDRGPPAAGRPRRRRRARGLRAAGRARARAPATSACSSASAARTAPSPSTTRSARSSRPAPTVKRSLGPISPLVTDAIQKQRARPRLRQRGRPHAAGARRAAAAGRRARSAPPPCSSTPRYLEPSEWDLWRRTAVRIGVLMLLLTGITWIVVRWSVTRPMARIAEWTKQLKSGQPVAPPPEADASLFGSLADRGHRAWPARWPARGWPPPRRRGCGWPATACGRRSASSSSSRSGSASGRSSSCPTASRSATCSEGRRDRRACSRPAASSPRWSRSCWRAAACGWPTAAAAPTAMVGERIGLPADDPAYTLRRVWLDARRRRPGTTTASPTRGCGRSATSCTSGRSSAPTTGSSTARSTRTSPARSSRRWRRPSADRAGPGLSLRAAAPAHQAGAPGRAGRAVLAHPVAQLRGLRHLPLAGGDPARHAGRRPRRLPHPVPLQQLPGDGRAHDRGPGRVGGLHRRPRPAHAPACGRSRSAWRRTTDEPPRPTAPHLRAELGIDRGVAGRRRRAGGLHQGPARALARASGASSSAGRSTGGA